MTCQAPECYRPTRGGRTYCDAHQKRLQRGMSLSAPLDATHNTSATQRTPREAFLDAVLKYANANAESDAEFKKAEYLLMKWGRRHFRGPPELRVDVREVASMVRRVGSIRGAARAMGISRNAVRRALDRLRLRKGLGRMVPTGSPPDGEGD